MAQNNTGNRIYVSKDWVERKVGKLDPLETLGLSDHSIRVTFCRQCVYWIKDEMYCPKYVETMLPTDFCSHGLHRLDADKYDRKMAYKIKDPRFEGIIPEGDSIFSTKEGYNPKEFELDMTPAQIGYRKYLEEIHAKQAEREKEREKIREEKRQKRKAQKGD